METDEVNAIMKRYAKAEEDDKPRLKYRVLVDMVLLVHHLLWAHLEEAGDSTAQMRDVFEGMIFDLSRKRKEATPPLPTTLPGERKEATPSPTKKSRERKSRGIHKKAKNRSYQ